MRQDRPTRPTRLPGGGSLREPRGRAGESRSVSILRLHGLAAGVSTFDRAHFEDLRAPVRLCPTRGPVTADRVASSPGADGEYRATHADRQVLLDARAALAFPQGGSHELATCVGRPRDHPGLAQVGSTNVCTFPPESLSIESPMARRCGIGGIRRHGLAGSAFGSTGCRSLRRYGIPGTFDRHPREGSRFSSCATSWGTKSSSVAPTHSHHAHWFADEAHSGAPESKAPGSRMVSSNSGSTGGLPLARRCVAGRSARAGVVVTSLRPKTDRVGPSNDARVPSHAQFEVDGHGVESRATAWPRAALERFVSPRAAGR